MDYRKKHNITNLYDHLSRFVLFTNWLKFGDRFAGFTMHKTLRIPERERDRYNKYSRVTYLNDLALSGAELPNRPQVLDAGCGFGGTIFRWHDKFPGKYDGLTLSHVQIKTAQKEARRRGIEDQCHFYFRNYDEPLKKKYDAIVAIEALIHSSSLSKSLLNFTSALKKGGKLVLVDDMRVNDGGVIQDTDWQKLKFYWDLDNIHSAYEFEELLNKCEMKVNCKMDLTDKVNLMDSTKIHLYEKWFNYFEKVIPFRSIQTFIQAQMGGLALQKLYLKKKVQYILLIAEKN